jgi:site-specific DNA recombinase
MASNTVKKVKKIKANNPQFNNEFPRNIKKKVCAYCRVSTEHEEQESSFESQVSYYTQYINSRAEWTFVDIYADEGISGTNTKKRKDFLRMIDDCMAGKIDMIITKSISRFARNTVDCLHYVRMLKEKGISVYFETENIETAGTTGELLLTILSALAQDSSRNQSDVTRWGIQRKFESGKVLVNTTRFLGYDKNEDGELIINEEEAQIVRRIYREYLEGKSYNAIAKGLMKDKIKTAAGNEKWWDSTVSKILSNEKYYGDALLQKTVTVDFLSHKRIANKGLVQQYLIENNHRSIISREIFDKVQDEKERRALTKGNLVGNRHKYSSKYALSGKVKCGNCGNNFKRRTWNSNNASKKIVWQCKSYIENGKKACNAKAVDEQVLHDSFVNVFNRIYENRDEFTKTLVDNIDKVLAGKTSKAAIKVLDDKIEKLKDEIKKLIRFQVKSNIDSEIYDEEYKRLTNEFNDLKKETGRI